MTEISLSMEKTIWHTVAYGEVSVNFKHMKPAGPEQTQDTHEHDCTAPCVSKL